MRRPKGRFQGLFLIQSVTSVLPLLSGPQLTQVSVLQYGSITTIDVPWTVPLEKTHLLSLVDHMQQEGGPSQIGNALAGWGAGAASGPSSWYK